MYKGVKIGVIVPAYNEEQLIGKVIETMPSFVDQIIVVDDKSTDKTAEIVKQYQKESDRIILIEHQVNRGVGGAITSGYKQAIANGIEVAVVMAGDAQMDPRDLPRIIDPIVKGEVDYTKGNRLFRGESWKMIPHYRYFGNSILSLLTKIASGYWHIADSQSGYTAISLRALKALELDRIYQRYGMPNDLLIKLNVLQFKVRDVSIRPVYNIGEKSGIKLIKDIPRISLLLIKGFFWRLGQRYIIRDFHPLIFFYLLGLTLTPLGFLSGLYLVAYRILIGPVATTSALFASFLIISGLQSLFFAMWFDMECNKNLK
jgi:glycosyltransferase involved in cell wall biosynthesis